jgi:hypothetical protein
MLDLPVTLPLLMALCAFFAVGGMYRAAAKNKQVLWITGAWLVLQGAVSLTGFYHNDYSLPPRFALLVGPPLVLIAALFFSERGRHFLDSLHLMGLTRLHVVRIPVELCLLLLFRHGQVPLEMTFEGHNFDILSGLSTPVIVWLAFPKNGPVRRWLLVVWNVVCLGLLFNIVATAIAASPYFAGHFGFATPNVAVFYFPFVWLPCLIVPLVLLAHLAALRKLLRNA